MANLTRLPKAIIESYEWQYDGACVDVSPAVFFLPDDMRAMAKERHQAAAKQVCETCPVRQRFLEHALSVREPYGVWGGMTPEDRAAVLAARKPVVELAVPRPRARMVSGVAG